MRENDKQPTTHPIERLRLTTGFTAHAQQDPGDLERQAPREGARGLAYRVNHSTVYLAFLVLGHKPEAYASFLYRLPLGPCPRNNMVRHRRTYPRLGDTLPNFPGSASFLALAASRILAHRRSQGSVSLRRGILRSSRDLSNSATVRTAACLGLLPLLSGGPCPAAAPSHRPSSQCPRRRSSRRRRCCSPLTWAALSRRRCPRQGSFRAAVRGPPCPRRR